jgi:hypothetical protein
MLAVLVAGCASGIAHSEIHTGPDGLRTFTVIRAVDGNPVVCTAPLYSNPVHGRLEGEVGARDAVWLRAADGRHLSVVWPEGFSLVFDPDAALFTDKGVILARAGDNVALSMTLPDSAAGTYDDPYIASGLVFGDCYPFLR